MYGTGYYIFLVFFSAIILGKMVNEWLGGRRMRRLERDIPEINKRRAPGNTCITALQQIKAGTVPHNDSKGCGGQLTVKLFPIESLSRSERHSFTA